MANLSIIVLFIGVLSFATSQVHLPLIRTQRADVVQKRGETVSLVPDGSANSNVNSYSAQITLGTPSQSLNVLVDTGSSDLIVYGSGCSGCVSSTVFTPGSSSSADTVGCNVQGYGCESCAGSCQSYDSYGSGQAFTGTVYTDKFSVGGLGEVDVSFSVISKVDPATSSSPFGSGLQGLMGLAYDYYSFAPQTVFQSLVAAGLPNTFSMCLTADPVLSLGVDYSADTAFLWTPIVQETYYTVGLSAISVGTSTLSLTQTVLNPAIIDSGTTFLAMESTVYTAIYNAIKATCTASNKLVGLCDGSNPDIFAGQCFSFTEDQINAYPTIYLTLPGVGAPLTITPAQYLVPLAGGSYRCGGIQNSNQNLNILGDVFMSGYHIAFDVKNTKIGFAPTSTCPSTGQTTSNVTLSGTSTSTSSQSSPSPLGGIDGDIESFFGFGGAESQSVGASLVAGIALLYLLC